MEKYLISFNICIDIGKIKNGKINQINNLRKLKETTHLFTGHDINCDKFPS